jgi:hypothetical protein
MYGTAGWHHKTPQSRFWLGSADESEAVGLSYEVGALLFIEGFWDYCKEHIPTDFPNQFNGPWEGGQIEPPEIQAFVDALNLWRSRYDGAEDTVIGPWRWGLDGSVKEEVEASPEEIQDALRRIEVLAHQAKSAMAPLFFAT